MYDAIIIGAGMSGLAAGIRLAHFGQRVCILERHYAIGGLNSYYRLGGRNYDVGLHAVTNYRPRGDRRGPLPRLLRQLRLDWDDFGLVPQLSSRVAFPQTSLEFSNEPALLEAEVAAKFPGQIDGFRRLVGELPDYDVLGAPEVSGSAREAIGRSITDPLLREMLLCPVLFYGGPSEHDLEFGQFGVLFRSIVLEGLARPAAGVRRILKTLVRRYKSLGGELRLRAGVQRLEVAAGMVAGVVLDDGTELAARQVLSSAGWAETWRLFGSASALTAAADEHSAAAPVSGRLSFVESNSALDVPPAQLGCPHTIVFFNDSEKFHWQQPDELADVRSGVICAPSNFAFAADSVEKPPEPAVRLTALANYPRWAALNEADYAAAKQDWYARLVESAIRFVPDFRPHVVAVDMFTPTTIRRFTGHDNGTVYGAPRKRYDGTTPVKNLLLCGTDHGLVGIIGAMTSGIIMANRLLNSPAQV